MQIPRKQREAEGGYSKMPRYQLQVALHGPSPRSRNQEALVSISKLHSCCLLSELPFALLKPCCRFNAGAEQLLACWCWVVTYYAGLAGTTEKLQDTADQLCNIQYGELLCSTVERPFYRLAG